MSVTSRSSRVHCEPSPEAVEEYRPDAFKPYQPAPFSEAFWSGLQLGLAGECAASLHGTASERRAFEAGWVAGHREYERDMAEWAAQMEREAAEAADPFGGLHPAEMIEAFGAVAFREIGGGL